MKGRGDRRGMKVMDDEDGTKCDGNIDKEWMVSEGVEVMAYEGEEEIEGT